MERKHNKNIILLNFEDDTTIPVIDIQEKYIKIINKWYEDCGLILDIEKTNVSIPENITVKDVSEILFNEININYKDEYLDKYLPLIIQHIISNRLIKDYELKYFTNKPFLNQYELSNSASNLKYEIFGIKIPQNLLEYDSIIKKEKNIQNVEAYNFKIYTGPASSNTTPVSSDYKEIEIEPYNKVYDNTTVIQNDNDDPNRTFFCYNSDYDTLKPKFGNNCYFNYNFIFQTKNNDTIKNIESVFVIYNYKFLQTLCIINPNSDILHILKNNSEFRFIKLFNVTTNNTDILKFVKNEFDKKHFYDVDELNEKLKITSQYSDFFNKYNNSSEEINAIKIVNSLLTVDNNNNKIKSSILHDVINSKAKTANNYNNGFKNRIPKYLKDLGLVKKLEKDGYYYYGIRYKFNKNNNKITQLDIDEYIKDRKDPIEMLEEETKRIENKRLKEGTQHKLI